MPDALSLLHRLLGSLNRNQGALQAVFAGVVAASTVFYVLLTRALVRETIRMREAATEPALAVYLMPGEKWPNMIDIVIRNYGHGPALDIQWGVEGDEETKKRYANLLNLALLNRLSYFPPGEQFRSYLGTGVDLLSEQPAGSLKITATYKATSGRRDRTQTFLLDAEQFRHLATHTSEDVEISRALKELTKAAQGIQHALEEQQQPAEGRRSLSP